MFSCPAFARRVSTGKSLLAIVPLQAIYVEVNFRETQLERVRPRQPVRITIAALPSVALSGHVERLGPASGVSYSAIAPHNATGNFTKICNDCPSASASTPGKLLPRNCAWGFRCSLKSM